MSVACFGRFGEEINMNIIYFSSSCSDEKFNQLRQAGITQKMPQAQKYHRLLMEGIAQNIDGKMVAVSAFPVNRQWTKKVRFDREEETVNNIRYIYGSFLNLPVLRQITRYLGAVKDVKKCAKAGQCIFVCDILNQSIANAARKMGRRMGVPVVGIVTDVPGHTSGARRNTHSFLRRQVAKWAEKQAQRNMVKYDAYLFLTEAMNSVVNLRNKPYIVIEGHADVQMGQRENALEGKQSPKVMMYAGGIHKEFGIQRLVNAFVEVEVPGWELHIYGDGNYQKELKELTKTQRNVKYFGVQPNSLVVENQLKASLLVNPRLTDAEYVKYSFPSKTLECMISGTPLLTTNLPGMPQSYHQYVYLFGEETEMAFQEVLKRVLSLDAETLHARGKKAKCYALEEKNNVTQAKKLCDFMKMLKR